MDINKAVQGNPMVNKLLKIVPDNPLDQTQYMYYLTLIVFIGLMGFAIVTWYEFFVTMSPTVFFRGVFMGAIGLLSLFGVKQTRKSYLLTKFLLSKKTNQPDNLPEDTVDEMMEAFEEEKK